MSRKLSINRSNQSSLVMCDFLQIVIPFRRDPRISHGGQSVYDGHSAGLCDRLWQLDFEKLSSLTGISLRASSVSFDASRKPTFSELTHAIERVSSSNHALIFAVRQCAPQTGLPPHLVFHCSPSAMLHTQNVISQVNTIESGAWINMSALAHALPDLMPFLDVENAMPFRVDATDAYVCETPAQAEQVLQRMGAISVRQQRAYTGETQDGAVARLAGYKTTRYWNPKSTLHSAVAYLKGPQLQDKIDEAMRDCRKHPRSLVAAERLKIVSDPRLMRLAQRMVRLEGRWKKRGLVDQLTRFGLTSKKRPWDGRLLSLIELERAYNDNPKSEHCNLLTALWHTSWQPLLEALHGAEDMDLNDYDAIEKSIFTAHQPRVARPLAMFFRTLTQLGYHDLRESSLCSKTTFNRRINQLVDLGLSRAQLQALDGTAESRIDAGVVIPLQRVLSVGRMTEFPAWFERVDLDQWAPFDPTLRYAVGAPVGPVPLPVQQARTEAVAAELPTDEEIRAFFAPVGPTVMGPMHPDANFTPVAAGAAQLGLDFSGPDSSITRGRGSNSGFTRAVEQIRAAQVGEGLQLGVQRPLIDGTQFVPPIAPIIPIRRGHADCHYAHVRD